MIRNILLLLLLIVIVSCNKSTNNTYDYKEYICYVNINNGEDIQKILPVSYIVESDGIKISDYFVSPDCNTIILISVNKTIWKYDVRNDKKTDITNDYPFQQDLCFSLDNLNIIYVSDNDIIKTNLNLETSINITDSPDIKEVNPVYDYKNNILYVKIEKINKGWKNTICRYFDEKINDIIIQVANVEQSLAYPVPLGFSQNFIFNRLEPEKSICGTLNDSVSVELYVGDFTNEKCSVSSDGIKFLVKNNENFFIYNKMGILYNDIYEQTGQYFENGCIGSNGQYAVFSKNSIISIFKTITQDLIILTEGDKIKISGDDLFVIKQ